jgi:1,4-dihydroxy-2-naphthoate polyprenyltransferase
MIQITTNFFNEIYDAKRGADTEDRIGPPRGVIPAQTMWRVTIICLIITFLAGLYLAWVSDWYILAVGIISLFFSWAYTGGPYPLAYKGLGDIFVLIFFGIVAVCGTFYVFTGYVDMNIFFISLIPGLLSANILGVNNMRDIETDRKVKKMTLAVRLGKKKSEFMYYSIVQLAMSMQIGIAIGIASWWIALPLIVYPFSVYTYYKLQKAEGTGYNKVLAMSGAVLMLYGILQIIGFIYA